MIAGDAYESFLKGRAHLVDFTPEAWKRAKAHFEQAIARDSSYAEPHAELVLGHFISGMLAAFEHSHALAPWFAITSGRLAAVLRTLGQNTRADAVPDLKHPTSSHAAVISQLRKSSRTLEGPQRARFAFGS